MTMPRPENHRRETAELIGPNRSAEIDLVGGSPRRAEERGEGDCQGHSDAFLGDEAIFEAERRG